jgi:uncharacterized protein (UPF0147 family)
MTEVQGVIETIKEMLDDPTLQKNIKQKLERVIAELNTADKKTLKLKVDKCIDELEEVSNDSNTQSFVRTQVWGIVSMLESLD